MFLNDLAVEIKGLNAGINIDGSNVTILMYADDIVLLAPTEECLQKQLDALHNWCRRWRMVVNEEKSQVVHFRPPRQPVTTKTFKYGSQILSIVNEYKYLGVFLDEHLNFDSNCKALARSASRALGLIRYKLRYLKECGCLSFTKLFTSFVCPILDYCSGVWGVKAHDNIEKVQFDAIRYFLGVHKFAPKDMLIGDVGWTSCFSRHKLALLNILMGSRFLLFTWNMGFLC